LLGEIHQILLNDFSMQLSPKTVNCGRKDLGFSEGRFLQKNLGFGFGYRNNTSQNALPSGGGRSLGAKISGGRGRHWGIFFGFYKTRYILLSDSGNCTVLCAVVLTQYRRVTDGRADRQTELLWLVQRLQCEHCGAL